MVFFGLALLLPLSAWATPARSERPAVLETPHARIFYHPDDQYLAMTTAEAIELAYRSIGQDLGYPSGRIDVYIHQSNDEMVTGLMTMMGYERRKAELMAMIGVSPSTKHQLHLHAKAKRWGPFLWHAVVHEYAHGVVEDRYGMTVASSGRWLYEGLGDYEAHRSLKGTFPEFEERWSRSRSKIAVKALIVGKWLPLAHLTTEEQWSANIEKSRNTWDIQYAEAYAAVSYLIEQHGFERLKALLEAIKAGRSLQEAMEHALGMSVAGFEATYWGFLVRKGVFDLYALYTAGLLLAGVVGVIGSLFLRRYRRSSRRSGASKTSANKSDVPPPSFHRLR